MKNALSIFVKAANRIAGDSVGHCEGAEVFIFSNHTDKRTRDAAHNAGGTAFFDKEDLLSLVEFLRRQL